MAQEIWTLDYAIPVARVAEFKKAMTAFLPKLKEKGFKQVDVLFDDNGAPPTMRVNIPANTNPFEPPWDGKIFAETKVGEAKIFKLQPDLSLPQKSS